MHGGLGLLMVSKAVGKFLECGVSEVVCEDRTEKEVHLAGIVDIVYELLSLIWAAKIYC